MPDFRRGAAEVEKAQQKRSGGGNFAPFAPTIFWKAGDERYLLVLTDIESMPRLDVIDFIPVEHKRKDDTTWTTQEMVLSRTDPVIGESVDPINKEFDGKIKDSNMVVVVELEPEMKEVRKRQRPVGFTVKTFEIERRIRDEEGNVTEETETVTVPAWGFVTQAVGNFGAALVAYDQSEAALHETPIKIQRIGGDKNTSYAVHGYPELAEKVDLSGFVDNLDGIAYLGEHRDEIQVDEEDPFATAYTVGNVLLDLRLNELADDERYERILEAVREKGESLDKFGGGKKNQKSGNGAAKTERPSQRKAAEPKTEKQRDPEALEALQKLRDKAASRK